MGRFRATDLLGLPVLDEDGTRLGRVYDLRLRIDGPPDESTWRLDGLVVGRRGLLERFGFAAKAQRDPLLPGDVVPWDDVVAVGNEIRVRRGAEAGRPAARDYPVMS
jgi:sporulation protein YlmC with PRC-barrel domain